MSTLGRYLWKEWREFRSITIGILVAAPLLLGILGFLVPSQKFADPSVGRGFTMLGAIGTLAITLFALTTDLFAGEVRRGRVAFLDRLPAGLRAPFFAKALVYIMGTAGAFLYGFEVASLITEWNGGTASLTELLSQPSPRLLFCALIVWGVFPVSCMAPRGVLTLPLAALVFGGLTAGVLSTGLSLGGINASFFSWGMQGFLLAAVLVTAYVAFVRGYRAGGGWPRAMVAGVALLLLASAVPLAPHARAAMIAAGWVEGESRVAMAYMSRDGTFVYLMRYSRISENKYVGLRARRVDLRTGNAETLDARMIRPPLRDWMAQQPARWPYLRCNESLIDTDTGVAVDLDETTVLRESRRAATPFRTADGRKIWFQDDRVVTGGLVDRTMVLRGPGYPSGFGAKFFFKCGVFDTTRGKFFTASPQYVCVRPGRWIAQKRFGVGPLMLLDPETEEWGAAQGFAKGDHVAAVHDDGRLFVQRSTGALVLVDPETGVEEVVCDSDGRAVEMDAGSQGFRDAARFGQCAMRTPGGARVFMVDGVPARYDAQTSQLVRAKIRAHEPMSLIGCATEDVVYVLVDERRIERLELGTPSRTVVYAEE